MRFRHFVFLKKEKQACKRKRKERNLGWKNEKRPIHFKKRYAPSSNVQKETISTAF